MHQPARLSIQGLFNWENAWIFYYFEVIKQTINMNIQSGANGMKFILWRFPQVGSSLTSKHRARLEIAAMAKGSVTKSNIF
jgi:hypothetical protein